MEKSDAIKFKEEFESLNNAVRKGTTDEYCAITIPEDNPIKYISIDETIELLKSNQAVILVGANWCPWCRGAVRPLLDVVKDCGIKSLYYLNLDNDRSTFEIRDGKILLVKKGSEKYYQLLDILKEFLKEYTLSSDGQTYDIGEKRIYIPSIITIKNKEVLTVDDTTVELEANQTKYSPISKEQYMFYYEYFGNLIRKVYSNSYDNENKMILHKQV